MTSMYDASRPFIFYSFQNMINVCFPSKNILQVKYFKKTSHKTKTTKNPNPKALKYDLQLKSEHVYPARSLTITLKYLLPVSIQAFNPVFYYSKFCQEVVISTIDLDNINMSIWYVFLILHLKAVINYLVRWLGN